MSSDVPQKPPTEDNLLSFFESELDELVSAHDALVKLIDPALSVRKIAIMKEILWQGYLAESKRLAEKYRGGA